MKLKILFVDDCSTTLLLEQMRFAGRADYDLVLARNGWEAVQKAACEQPNLILMDATEANIAASQEMRKIEQLKRVPILLVSTASEPAPLANNAGDVDAPLAWTQLFEMVDTYLTARGANS
jgi:CheY-like chemotaxis protein